MSDNLCIVTVVGFVVLLIALLILCITIDDLNTRQHCTTTKTLSGSNLVLQKQVCVGPA